MPCPLLRREDLKFVVGILAVFFFALFLALDVPFAIGLPVAVLLALTGQHFVNLVWGFERESFGPLTFVNAYFMIDFGLRALYLTLSPNARRLGRIGYDDYLPIALWCATAAYLSFVAGFRSGWAETFQRGIPKMKFSWPTRVPALRTFILSICGFCVMVYLFKTGTVAVGANSVSVPVSGFIIVLPRAVHLAWIATCICLLTRQRIANRSLAWPLLLLSLAVLGLGVVMTGGKEALIESVLEALIVFDYLKKRLRPWQVLVFLVPTALLGFGLLNFYRFVIVGQQGSPRGFADIADRALSAVQGVSSGKRTSALEQMLSRQAGVDALALVMKYTPNPRPFAYGDSLLRAVVSTVIPRQLWPEKPIYDPGRELEQNYMGMPKSYEGHSSFHVVTELYENFWYVGAFVGMFVLGAVFRLTYVLCSPGPDNPVGVYFYAFLIPVVSHLLENALGAMLIQLPRAIMIAACAAIFLNVRRQVSPAKSTQTRFSRLKPSWIVQRSFSESKAAFGHASPVNR